MYRHPTESEQSLLQSQIHWFYVDRYGNSWGAEAIAERDAYIVDIGSAICCFNDDGELQGFVCWAGNNIDILYVCGIYRHQGIGSHLLYLAMQEIGENVTASLKPDWQDALEFLGRFGFRAVCTILQHDVWTPIGRTPEEILKHLREEKGWTREEAADKARLEKEDVLRAEDDVSSVRISVLCTLARTYGVSIGYILTPDLDVCRTTLSDHTDDAEVD